jgi:hypothetical protein
MLCFMRGRFVPMPSLPRLTRSASVLCVWCCLCCVVLSGVVLCGVVWLWVPNSYLNAAAGYRREICVKERLCSPSVSSAAAAVDVSGDIPRPVAADPMPDRVKHGEQEGAALPAVTVSRREADADSVRAQPYAALY